MTERRQRIDAVRRRGLAGFLRDLPITIDGVTELHAWDAVQGLAERFRLTIYDAAHLELAQRTSLPLASLDRELCSAARALGLLLVDGAGA